MIEPKHIPFALARLPFLSAGIVLPVSIQDWFHNRLTPIDGGGLLALLAVAGGWQWAIIGMVKEKRRQGQSWLWGRELTSWVWAPPVTLLIGMCAGVFLLGS